MISREYLGIFLPIKNVEDAKFEVARSYRTVVEGHVENGKVILLKVTPTSRARDVVIVGE